jgi:diacylglycerol kinase (ATP)
MNSDNPIAPLVPIKKTGMARVLSAFGYSMSGLKSGWHEPAFRQEALLAVVLLPAAWWLGQSWAEVVLLVALTVAVLVVELLNTAVESVVDMASPEWHALAKRAKDTASAAVLLSLVVCGLAWVSALWRWVQSLLV